VVNFSVIEVVNFSVDEHTPPTPCLAYQAGSSCEKIVGVIRTPCDVGRAM
jgi:hypothetical protein